MPHTHANRPTRPTATVLLVLLAALMLAALSLAACGGSSKGSSSATDSASASATNGKRDGQFAARASALRECLKKNGVTLPNRRSGQGGPGGGRPGTGGPEAGGPGAPGGPYGGPPPSGAPSGQPPRGGGPFGSGATGGPRLPKGVTRSQFEAAFKKCGGGAFRRGGRGFNSAQGRQRFAKFAECMRDNGVKLPAPNTSGNGPIFNTKGIDTNSAAFKAAAAKCTKELRPSGGGAVGAPSGAPAGPAG